MYMAMHDQGEVQPLETTFRQHIANTIECQQVLHELFANLGEPGPRITRIKQLEARGDKLTSQAYAALELQELSDLSHITEDLVKRLDDVIDGFNETAQLIDIFHSDHIETAAYDILAAQQAMLERLQQEFEIYPQNDLATLRSCCTVLKSHEEKVDQIYHEWRKKERRMLELSLIDEFNWTELFGVLEQTTDDIYHTALLLERLTKYRQRSKA